MHDAADDSAIVRPLDAPDIRRQLRLDPLPLLIAQPKQVAAHDPNPLPKTNQDRIVRAEKLMSSDPRTYLKIANRSRSAIKYRMIRFTDKQWERIRSHFPEEHIADGRPGRKPIPTRRVLEAVLWLLNTGAQWHMLPQSYPN